jgi:hypothetical protein
MPEVDWWGVIKIGAMMLALVLVGPVLLRLRSGGGSARRRGRLRYGPSPTWWMLGWLSRRVDTILLALTSATIAALIALNAMA